MENNITDILLAPWKNGVITAAVRLNVFTIISDKMLAIEEIASQCAAHPDRLKPLLEACRRLGFLEYDNAKYRNTSFSFDYFVEGERLYAGDFLKLVDDESLGWFQLPDLIRGKEKSTTALPRATANHRTFINAMDCIGRLGEAEALKNRINLSGCKTMTDAGGGSGVYSLALCQEYPDLQSTVLDVKDTLVVTQDFLKNTPANKRITLREGNYLKGPLGDNLDVVLLSDVIYKVSEARIVLRNAWNSLSRDGILVIRGYYSDIDRPAPLLGALFAVKQLVDDPQKKTMSISGLAENVEQTGFDIVEMASLTEYSYFLVGKKRCEDERSFDYD